MGPRRCTVYRSFEYLEPRIDYRRFVLTRQAARVETYRVEVTEAQEERAQPFLDDQMVISLHEHTIVIPEDASQTFPYISDGRAFTGYQGLPVSHLNAFGDFLLDGLATLTSRMGWS